MKIIIKATNLSLTSAIKSYIEKKTGELDKFVQKLKIKSFFEKGKPLYELWIEVEKTTRHHQKGKIFRTEAQLRLPGKSIRVEAVEEELYSSIDVTKDKLQRELKKYSRKIDAKYKRGARKFKREKKSAESAQLRKDKRGRVLEEGF